MLMGRSGHKTWYQCTLSSKARSIELIILQYTSHARYTILHTRERVTRTCDIFSGLVMALLRVPQDNSCVK